MKKFKLQLDKFTGPMYVRLWTPAMISALGWALSDMADAVVVGQKLGTVGLAAISLILPIYMINCAIAHGFGIGGSARFSHILAQGKDDDAKNNFSSVVLVSTILSVLTAILGIVLIKPLLAFLGTVPADGELFSATKSYLVVLLAATPLFYLSNILNYYLRNDEEEKIAGIGSVTGNLLDIACNITFVLVFGLGTFGAALSTAIGQIVSISIYSVALFKKNNHLSFVRINKKTVSYAFSCFKSGAASSVKYLYQMAFFLICNNVLIRISGESGVAVFDLIQNTSYLILYLYEGTSRAMQPLVSTYQGEHNLIGKKSIRKIGFASGILVGTLLILAIQIEPVWICMLFGVTEAETIAIAEIALRIFTLGAFFGGINIMLANYYESSESEKAAFIIETMRGAALLLPFTALFSFIGDIVLFWWLFPATEILCFVIFLLCRNKFMIPGLAKERVFQTTIQGNEETINDASISVGEFCENWGCDLKRQYIMTLTIEEIAMAILVHGLKNVKNGYIQITVLAFENGDFEIHLRDNAVTFNPFSLEKEEKLENNEDFTAVGVDIIRKKATLFHYRRYQGFNALIVRL